MKTYKCILAVLLAVMIVLTVIPAVAAADTLKLTIVCEDGGKALADIGFDIYKVADIDSRNGTFTLTDDLSGYGVDPGSYNNIPKALAPTLEGIVLKNDIKPAASVKTDGKGVASFTTTGSGLYLVRADRATIDGSIYDFTPFMVILDSTYVETSDVTVNAKFEVTPPFVIIPTSVKVIKLWNDNDDRENRPESVKVDLLRDGEVYDTAYLTPENGWKHTWEKLDRLYSWTVTEEVPEGYTMTIEKDGTTFVITNTKTTKPPPDTETTDTTSPDTEPETTIPDTEPDTTAPDETTGPSETTVPDTEPDTTAPDTEPVETKPTETTPSEPTLPQTGQLWWPVPALVVIGLALVIIGLVRSKGASDEEEKR